MKLFTALSLGLALILSTLVMVALAVGKTLPSGADFSFAAALTSTSPAEIYAFDPTHLVEINLTRNPANDIEEAWSPDGRRMAFISNRDGLFQLYVMTLSGGVRRVGKQEASPNYRPVWSPDGTSLVYEVNVTNGDDIAVVNVDQPLADRTNPHILARSPNADRYPVWSPDGQWIAFTSWRTGDAEILLIHPDGSDLTDLTNDPNDDVSPAWSPNGQQIAFFSLRSGYRELYIMQRDGSDVRPLSSAQQASNGSYWGAPLWSPDGQAIAYQTVSAGLPSIAVVRLDGSVEQRLINGQGDHVLLNGERLAYRATGGERTLLYLIEADGSSPRALTPMDAINPFSALWEYSGS